MDYRGDFAPYAGSLDSRCLSQRYEVKTMRRNKSVRTEMSRAAKGLNEHAKMNGRQKTEKHQVAEREAGREKTEHAPACANCTHKQT